MNKPQYYLNNTARQPEILAFFLLRDNVFASKDLVYIGDGDVGLADLYSSDLDIGVEVVTCENTYVHVRNSLTYPEQSYVFDTIKGKFESTFTTKNRVNLIKDYEKFIKNQPYTSLALNPKDNVKEKQLFEEEVRKNLNKKLKLLNEGKYSKFNQMHLFVMSDFKQKDYAKIDLFNKIYKEESAKYTRKFDKVFVLLNREIQQLTPSLPNKLIAKKKEVHQIYKEVDFIL